MQRAGTHDHPVKETVPPPMRLPRQRRRSMLVLAVLLVGAGALTGTYVIDSLAQRTPVVVLARDAPVGTQLTPAHLATTRVSVDPAVSTIPARQRSEVVGKIAQVDLRRGTLLAPSQLTGALSPGPGRQVVTIALKASQLPARGLRPGDQVLVVATPGSQGQETAGGGGRAALAQDVAATIDQVGEPDAEGLTAVDLQVPASSGPLVVRQASTGRVALLVTSRRP